MGDAADWLMEQGANEYDAHLRGECDGPCQYCEQEEAQRAKWRSQKRRQRATRQEEQP